MRGYQVHDVNFAPLGFVGMHSCELELNFSSLAHSCEVQIGDCEVWSNPSDGGFHLCTAVKSNCLNGGSS